MTQHTHATQHRALLAAALLTSSSIFGFAGQADARSAGGKPVIEPAPENPLCFLDGAVCFDVQERLRFEVRSDNFDFNDSTNVFTDDAWLLQRFRIGVMVKPTPWLKIYAQGQDSREFESDRPNLPGALGAEGDDNFDLRQAYVEVGPFADVTLKVGRQTLVYGDERLIGAFDWNNFGRTFDAVKLVYKQPAFQVDLFTSSVVVVERDQFNKSDLFNGNERDRQQIFSGLYVTSGEVPWGSAEAYALLLDQKNGNAANLAGLLGAPVFTGSPTEHSDFATFGFRLTGSAKKLHGFEFNVEAAYQNGQVRDLALSAFAVTAGAGYNFDIAWKPRFWTEYNFASGDTDPLDNNIETFQNLFPTNHKFYGYADFFAWQNLHNPMASVRLTPLTALTVQLDYHAFFLATNEDLAYRANGVGSLRPLTPAARKADQFVGQEIDFTATWTVSKHLAVQAGYSHFFAGDYLAETGASDDADFGYVMATLNF